MMAFLAFCSLSTRLIVLRILITLDFAALASVRGMSIRLSFHMIRFCFCCVDFFDDSTFLFTFFFTTCVQLCGFCGCACCFCCCCVWPCCCCCCCCCCMGCCCCTFCSVAFLRRSAVFAVCDCIIFIVFSFFIILCRSVCISFLISVFSV